jgi:hypothetical protein
MRHKNMAALTIYKIVEELKDFPADKISSLYDYILFLKKQKKSISDIKFNRKTIQAMNDVIKNKNLTSYKSIQDFFQDMKK